MMAPRRSKPAQVAVIIVAIVAGVASVSGILLERAWLTTLCVALLITVAGGAIGLALHRAAWLSRGRRWIRGGIVLVLLAAGASAIAALGGGGLLPLPDRGVERAETIGLDLLVAGLACAGVGLAERLAPGGRVRTVARRGGQVLIAAQGLGFIAMVRLGGGSAAIVRVPFDPAVLALVPFLGLAVLLAWTTCIGFGPAFGREPVRAAVVCPRCHGHLPPARPHDACTACGLLIRVVRR